MATNSANWRMADRLASGRLDRELADLVARVCRFAASARCLYDRYGIEVTAPTVKAWLADIEEQAA